MPAVRQPFHIHIATVCWAQAAAVKLLYSDAFWVGSTSRVVMLTSWGRPRGPLDTTYQAEMLDTCHRYWVPSLSVLDLGNQPTRYETDEQTIQFP